jgi:glycosyltransferase involved in cell wall biosynthesis
MNILFLMQLPPPVHGAALMNSYVKEYYLNGGSLESSFVDISMSKSHMTIGKFSFLKIFIYLKILFRVLFLLIKLRPSSVYITMSPHGMAFLKDSILVIIGKIFVARVFVHFHGKGVKHFLEGRPFLSRYYRFILNDVTIIHLDQNLVSDIEEYCDKKNISIVPNGVPDEFENQLDGLSNREIDVLYLSNMKESKGWRILLEAAFLLKEKKIRPKIVFSGSWEKLEDFTFFNNYIKKNDLTNVTYIGPSFGEEKNAILRKSKIFVLPTSNDCMPISIIEAQSAGLVIISTNQGAISSLVCDNYNGYIVEPSPVKLASAIEKTLSDKEQLEKFGSRSRKLFLEKFTEHHFTSNLSAVIGQIK